MSGALDRRDRSGTNDLTDDQVIKEHFDGGQMLFDRLRRACVLFDVSRDVHRCDQPNVIDVILGPVQKLSARPCVCKLRVCSGSGSGREKLKELRSGVFAGDRQDRRWCGRGAGSMRSFWRHRVPDSSVLMVLATRQRRRRGPSFRPLHTRLCRPNGSRPSGAPAGRQVRSTARLV
jgi:hypothetical protein